MAMFWLLGEKGVIHIPEPQSQWIVHSADGLGFKVFHEWICYYGADGGNLWLPHEPVKILTPKEEMDIFEENLQQGDDVFGKTKRSCCEVGGPAIVYF